MEWSTRRPKESGWYWCWKMGARPKFVEFRYFRAGEGVGTYVCIEPAGGLKTYSHFHGPHYPEAPKLPEPRPATFSGLLDKWNEELCQLDENAVTIRRYIKDFVEDLERLWMREYHALWERRLRKET